MWIENALADRGLSVTGEIEQPHVRVWSTVMRVPTAAGDVWFKAAVPGLAHDAAVTAVLARLRPDLVLTPLAVDPDNGWMILPDGGNGCERSSSASGIPTVGSRSCRGTPSSRSPQRRLSTS